MKRTFVSTVLGFAVTATIVLSGAIHFSDKSEYLFISSRVRDSLIAKDADRVLAKANQRLSYFGHWHTDSRVRAKHREQIAAALLVIAAAKEAKNLPAEEVLNDYYELVERFPNSKASIEALSKIAALDRKNGPEYVIKFLEKLPTSKQAVVFYAAVIRSHLSKSDYLAVEEYVKHFIGKWGYHREGVKLIAQLIRNIGRIKESEQGQLDNIIERNITEDPNSALCCAVFRKRALKLLEAKDSNQLTELAESIYSKFENTRLGICALGVLADSEYKKGNYLAVVELFRPGIFAEKHSQETVIKDIDLAVSLYNANTLRK